MTACSSSTPAGPSGWSTHPRGLRRWPAPSRPTSTGSSTTRRVTCPRSSSSSSTRRSTPPMPPPRTGAPSRRCFTSVARTTAGFVVLHGTDTMAYTSSALSFLLPSFGKPVVVTGSQIPISRTRSDGRQNFIGALQVAARPDLSEVSLLFGEVVLRGNRATKIDASGLDAFASPRLAPLADIGIDIVANPSIAPVGDGAARLVPGPLGKVAAMRLFPGFSASILANLCRPPLQGLVLEAYGAGNGPANDRDFLMAIERAAADGIVVVVVTQCVRGSVQPGAYATGSALLRRRRGARLRHDERSRADQAGRPARRGPRRGHGRRDDATQHRGRADPLSGGPRRCDIPAPSTPPPTSPQHHRRRQACGGRRPARRVCRQGRRLTRSEIRSGTSRQKATPRSGHRNDRTRVLRARVPPTCRLIERMSWCSRIASCGVVRSGRS